MSTIIARMPWRALSCLFGRGRPALGWPCRRKSLGGTSRFEEERLVLWRCRYCTHEVGRSY